MHTGWARASLHRDDKVLAGWNGLLMGALSLALSVLRADHLPGRRPGDLDLPFPGSWSQGTLSATSRDGLARGIGFLEDYAFCAFGLLSLYEATLEPSYLSQAQTLCRQVLTDFTDPSGGFFLTPQNADPLLIRPKDTADGALPSGNTMMAWNLIRLSHLTREDTWQRAAEAQMAFLSPWPPPIPRPILSFCWPCWPRPCPAEEITVVLARERPRPGSPGPFPWTPWSPFWNSPRTPIPCWENRPPTMSVKTTAVCLPATSIHHKTPDKAPRHCVPGRSL